MATNQVIVWITGLLAAWLMAAAAVQAQEPTLEPQPVEPTATLPIQPAEATPTDTPTAISTDTPTGVPTDLSTASATVAPAATSTFSPTPTATPTALWPTDTPTPTATWPATPTCADRVEPNPQPGSGPPLLINQAVNDLTLFPRGEADFFTLWGKAGKYYQVTTSTTEGVDTRVRVFDPTGDLVAENDDYTPGNPGSRLSFMAPGEGWFAVAVDSRAPTDWGCRKYSVTVIDVSPPTPTPTATPGPPPTPTRPATPTPPPTAIPGEQMYDAYESNAEFGTAANIGVGQTLNLNFNPYPSGSSGVDNDFFRLYVKAGDHLRIETTSLAEGLDTNLILYRGDTLTPLLGNDDCQPGERRSCLEWSPDYTGLAYLLAGPVGTIPEAVAAGSRAYNLAVTNLAGQPLTPEAAGSQAIPAAYGQPLPWAVTPVPPTPSGLLSGTPAWPGGASLADPTAVVVRAYSLTPPTPTPLPRQGVTVQLTIYYDENDNQGPDPIEGIAGLSIRALDSVTNQAIAQTFTDAYGHATLAVAAAGEVRLSVPYLGYNQAIQPPGKQLFVRLSPMRLPSLIP